MNDIGVSQDGFVATVEMRRPPHNFFDSELIAEIGEPLERRSELPGYRARRGGPFVLRRRRFLQAHGDRDGG